MKEYFSSKKILLLFLALCLLGSSIFFIKKLVTVKQKTPPDVPIIKIAAAPPAVPHLISNIIQKRGLDQKYGFKLEIVGVDPTQTISALNNGTADIAVIGVLPAVSINYSNKESDLKIFAPALKLSCPFVALSSSNIKDIQNFSGKKIGIPTKTGATYPLMGTIFRKLNIDIDKNYKLVEGQFFALGSMLDSGQVDAITGVCDEISNGKFIAQGNKYAVGSLEEVSSKAYGPDTSIILSGMAARKLWLEKDDGKLSSGFIGAFYDSVNYLKSDPQIFDDPEIKSTYKLSDGEVVEVKRFISDYNNYSFGDWEKTVESMNVLISDALKFGYIKGIPDSSIFFIPNSAQ